MLSLKYGVSIRTSEDAKPIIAKWISCREAILMLWYMEASRFRINLHRAFCLVCHHATVRLYLAFLHSLRICCILPLSEWRLLECSCHSWQVTSENAEYLLSVTFARWLSLKNYHFKQAMLRLVVAIDMPRSNLRSIDFIITSAFVRTQHNYKNSLPSCAPFIKKTGTSKQVMNRRGHCIWLNVSVTHYIIN